MDTASLMVILVTSAFGMGYFVYGKKQQMLVPLLAGIALCVYPYFVDGPWPLALIGLALMAAPFVLRF